MLVTSGQNPGSSLVHKGWLDFGLISLNILLPGSQ
uniref:Uncharacterized protein n=1 Tax=Arundo donax TaxID=35708 RepID=A0A0A8Y6T7_ARUDO